MLDVEEDPTCRFVDFTNETDWERFIAGLEETLRAWGLVEKGAASDGPKARILPLQQRHYLLVLHTDDAPAPTWTDATRHFTPTMLALANASLDAGDARSMHRFFGVESHLVLHQYNAAFGLPDAAADTFASISMDATLGVMDHDARTLLSSLIVALGNCNCTLPAFVRLGGDAQYLGAAVPGASGNIALHFETATVPEVPPAQQCLQGLMDFFQAKLQLPSNADESMHDVPGSDLRLGLSAAVGFAYAWHARTLSILHEEDPATPWRDPIDAQLRRNFPFQAVVWGPRVSPLRHLHLAVRWPALREGMFVDNVVHSSLDPVLAPEWWVSPEWEIDQDALPLTNSLRQLVQAFQQLRQVGHALLVSEMALGDNPLVSRYQESVPAARAAVAIGAAIGSWVKSTTSVDAVRDHVAHLFTSAPKDDVDVSASTWCTLPKVRHGVVVGQLVSRLAMLLVHEQGVHIQCAMWVEFVRLLRETWKAQLLLPWTGIGVDGLLHPGDVDPLDDVSMPTPDFHLNLLHQKLQMLNICIARYQRQRRRVFDSLQESAALGVLRRMDDLQSLGDSTRCVNIPKTQDPAPLTEDVAKQQQAILANLGVSAESTMLRQQIQSSSMLSDMQAFKAANPGTCLADFIRWYSPRDWLPRDPLDEAHDSDNISRFRQGQLSARMHEANVDAPTNVWHRLWASAAPVPAEKQRSLFNPVLEAEKVFDYLDTMSPRDLFYHLLVATLSNLSVLFATCHDDLPVVAIAQAALQDACDKAVSALDDEAVGSDGKHTTDDERRVLSALTDDAMEKALAALQRVEALVASAASAAHVLEGASPALRNALLSSTSSVRVPSPSDRAVLGSVLWPPALGKPSRPDRREYVLHGVAPRPFYCPVDDRDGRHPVVVSRLYAHFQEHSIRFATAMADTEF
ncbi:hypothetical protein SPRG_04252 [Saprolegnia parasitica CBS 223.65]|uniref:Rab3 GTPase-activating protein catalytic subunit n=1 Tax=Saprolegnia parasitica (strain CBS 223.65) TaxID=695850 RepID=A0A067CKR0_SAPPC|nr:hypothetical protein SPRG_04252 [Saprolegnia parasitica CBS 223.65]KDO31113.1 hypothetical protein SPRG_04252 [Saprolegnia parasitica CBS 223.65]|eukprot:XP_012198242.1 hypothetical protein SPRG_04252 [Saprolegnia parasitica CBS 223.65]